MAKAESKPQVNQATNNTEKAKALAAALAQIGHRRKDQHRCDGHVTAARRWQAHQKVRDQMARTKEIGEKVRG